MRIAAGTLPVRARPPMAESAPQRSRDIALLAFFALALLLYAPGLGWGLPEATRAGQVRAWGGDEIAPLGPIAELYSVLVRRGPPFNPQYPLFHYIVAALAVGPYWAFLLLTGGLKDPVPTYPYGLADPARTLAVTTVLVRFVSTLMAAGVVVLALRTGTKLRDRTTGLVAATLVLLSYPMFYYSRTSNVDMAALFWTALGLALFAEYLASGLTVRRAAALGAVTALATATKDASYAPLVLAAAILLVREWLRSGPDRARRTLVIGAAGLATLIAVYLPASGLILHPGRYWEHVRFITGGAAGPSAPYYFTTPATMAGYLGLVAKTGRHVAESLGAGTIALAVAGFGLALVRFRRLLLFVLPALGIIAVIVPARYVLLRFTMPVAYIFTFLAAYAAAEGLRAHRPWARATSRLLVAAACVWSGLRAGDLTVQMLADSRDDVSAWLSERLGEGEAVGYIGTFHALPRLPAENPMVRLDGEAGERPRFVVVPLLAYRNHDVNPSEAERTPAALAVRDGVPGYRRALTVEPRSLFRARPMAGVNPLVVIFEKEADAAPR